jgi:N-acyl homoserine lactone hydrolase
MHASAMNHHLDHHTATPRGRRWLLGALALATLAAIAPCGTASAQTPAPAVKLYIFDLGQLKSANPQPLLDRGVTVTDMSVVAYLIVHPRGTLLWDTGTIPDELVKPEGTTIARATVKKTLARQLAEIGYKPADITYLALSHYHYDHSANANAFAGSTWLVQRPERAAMFPDAPPANPIDPNVSAKFAALKASKTVLLDGDHDVFGDGSVVILSTPGHTPGHQSLFVKLANFGPLVLSGDLYHYPAERTLKDFLPFGGRGNDAQEAASKAKVEALLKDKAATLWIQHDIAADAKLKKSPGYYD